MEVRVEAMDTSFLTIAEAVELTGSSPSTIRRLIRTITDAQSHEDRDGIEPTPAQVTAFKKKAENFTWRIREDILKKNFKGAQKQNKKMTSEPTGDIMTILQKELELKNHQIEKQWEVIHALNDRLREGNILMGSLQKRLGPALEQSPAENIVDASSTTDSAEPAMAGSGKQGKKGIFGWMRR